MRFVPVDRVFAVNGFAFGILRDILHQDGAAEAPDLPDARHERALFHRAALDQRRRFAAFAVALCGVEAPYVAAVLADFEPERRLQTGFVKSAVRGLTRLAHHEGLPAHRGNARVEQNPTAEAGNFGALRNDLAGENAAALVHAFQSALIPREFPCPLHFGFDRPFEGMPGEIEQNQVPYAGLIVAEGLNAAADALQREMGDFVRRLHGTAVQIPCVGKHLGNAGSAENIVELIEQNVLPALPDGVGGI